MGFRAIKERTQRTVHAQFAVPALYRAEPEAAWLPVSVRVHDQKAVEHGEPGGYSSAQVVDIAPEIVFLLEEIAGSTPQRGAIVSVSSVEAWQIGQSDKGNRVTVTASAARINIPDASPYPVPDA